MLISDYLAKNQNTFPNYDSRTMKQFHGYSRGVLPHLSFQEGMFFITTRLYDSVPQNIIQEKRIELNITQQDDCEASRLDSPDNKINPKLLALWNFIQKYEDAGYGQCFLKNTQIAQIVLDSLFYYEKEGYQLLAWSIMPNHIHFVIKLLSLIAANDQNPRYKLADIMRKLKGYTARQGNQILMREGQQFWQKEYFDRYIRNEDHLRNAVKYIINNPLKMGYTTAFTGTIFDDDFSTSS